MHFPQPAGLKRAGSPSEDEKDSKKRRVDDAEITVCCLSSMTLKLSYDFFCCVALCRQCRQSLLI